MRAIGASPAFDFIIQPSYILVQTPDGRRERGLGDTNLDFKWRLHGSAPWTLGIRAGIDVPTAHADLGLPLDLDVGFRQGLDPDAPEHQ